MSFRLAIRAALHRIRRFPWRKIIPIGAGVLGVTLYVGLFVIPRTLSFSYAGDTCFSQLTFFPALERTIGTTDYQFSYRGGIKIGSLPLTSTSTCVTALQAPRAGNIALKAAPFGGIVFRTHINLVVPTAATLNSQTFSQPIPTAKPLKLQLSVPDRVFTYRLKVGDKTAPCIAKNPSAECDLAPLGLVQGQTYTVSVNRNFKGRASTTLLTTQLKTLSPVQVATTSVQQNETVYGKPRFLTLTTNKKLIRAEVTLVKQDGDKSQDIPITSTFRDTQLDVALVNDLDRQETYMLRLDHVEAIDGSTLAEPYQLTFTMSGGPKVVSVSIPKTGVGLSASAVVTFDQELSSTQDISKLVTFAGGTASITRKGSQIIYTLQNLPKCTDFTLTIAKGLASKYDITSDNSWSYGARTICHTVATIGYSAKGRPINAYYFGSGSSTVLFTGAIHGNEPSASYILNDFIADLEVNARSIPANRQIVIVPTVNPDGFAAGSRNNANRVNLNRNFATSDWKQDINDTNGFTSGGGGSSPMSEPETQALAALSSQLHPRLVLSYHAVGSVAIGNQVGDSSSLAATYASLVGYSNGTGNSDEIFNYEITGTYDDWLAQQLGVPSIVVELGSYSYRNYSSHKSAFWAMATS